MPFGPRDLVDLDCDLSQLVKIPGRPGYYLNRAGDVFTVRRLSQYTDDDGYKRINSGKFRAAVHQLLALVFLSKPLPGQNEVRHFDGNKSNNSIDNLKWGTRAENAADMARHGTAKGSKNGNAILTEDDVKEIKTTKPGGKRVHALASRFGVSSGAIKAILDGRNWGHVEV